MGRRYSPVEGLVSRQLTPQKEFWAGKSVVLTGHTGFKGAWLAKWLTSLGARVFGLSLGPIPGKSLYALGEAPDCHREFEVDLRDQSETKAALDACAPDIVLHLAAQSLVRYSYREPVETLATNIMGTAHILDALRDSATCRSIVCVTSDKCYENREWLWAYRENDAMGGHDPYSGSKGAAELVISSLRRSFFSGTQTGVASVRAGNVIGGGDWAEDRLIPDCIRAFEAGEPVVIRNPLATRPWQHVLEPLCGYLLLAQRLHQGDEGFDEGWNFGPQSSDVAQVGTIVDSMCDLWGPTASFHRSDADEAHEAMALNVDSAKAMRHLDWAPRLRLNQALEWTVGWYRRQADGETAHSLCLEQINRYMELGHDT